MDSYLEIGAVGWLHAGWIENYYSDDVPEDWRFAFYSKEFRTAVLAAGDFDYYSGEAAGDWQEDLYDGFTLFIEIDLPRLGEDDHVERLRHLVGKLDDRLGGFVIRGDDTAGTRELINSGKADWLMGAGAIHLDVPQDDHALNELVSQNPQLCWCWQATDTAGQNRATAVNNCQVVLLDTASFAADLRALSGIFQNFRSQNQVHEKQFVFFTGDPPGIGVMKQAQSVAILLGAA